MNSNVKSKEEKKYVQLSPDTVLHLAESVGLSNLNPSVARALAEDASYRCRELASLCGQFLRQGKRRKLTTQDVERAMKWYNAEPVYGHGAGSNEPGYTRIVETGKIGGSGLGNVPIYVPDEKLIDLRPYALTQSPAILASMSTIQGSWLTLEGNYLSENEESKPVEFPPQGSLTPQLIQYYSAVVGVILGNSDQMLQIIFDDLQSNSKIGVLLPLLVSFIRGGMQKHCENQTLIKRLLCLIQALFSNPLLNLSPKPYLSHLVTALLSSLIIDRPNRERNDFDCLSANVGHVQHASQILRQVLNRWATPVNQLRSQTHRALREYLKDGKISYSSHYGALSALIALGPAVLDECLLPQMDQYLNNTKEKIRSLCMLPSGNSIEKEMRKRVLMLMCGTILIGARSMLKFYIEEGGNASNDETREIIKRYEMFLKHFGDSLLCSISQHKFPGKRFLVKQPSGRLCLKKLRPASFAAKSTGRRVSDNKMDSGFLLEPKLEPEELLDYYSNSSRQDFSLLADMGVPTNIFEPEHRSAQSQMIHSGPKTIMSDAPENISIQVQRCFKTCHPQTVNRNQKIRFNFGAPNWSQNRLRRKWIRCLRVAPGFRSSGAIGKRLGCDESKLESRQQFLFNTFYLEHIL